MKHLQRIALTTAVLIVALGAWSLAVAQRGPGSARLALDHRDQSGNRGPSGHSGHGSRDDDNSGSGSGGGD